jgi:hypothetical protein
MKINGSRTMSRLFTAGALSAAFVAATAAGQGLASATGPSPQLHETSNGGTAASAAPKVGVGVKVTTSINASHVRIGQVLHVTIREVAAQPSPPGPPPNAGPPPAPSGGKLP